jgi:hypothetical protein
MRKKLPSYVGRGCVNTKNDSKWCNQFCVPQADGMGDCGRIAPHALKGRTQMAILEHNHRVVEHNDRMDQQRASR